ncbi:MAG: glycosyltransferase family 4 protein [Candidatus Nitrosotenuis sp.]
MKLLIAGASSKFFHLREFAEKLEQFSVETKLVHDIEVYDTFPTRKIKNWIPNKKKFNELIEDFKPDAVFIDRQAHFGSATLDAKIPLFVHLRGDYWSEMKWARETLYKSPVKRTVLKLKNQVAKKCFDGSALMLPICSYLKDIVNDHYPHKPAKILYQGITPSNWYPTEGPKLKHPCVGLLQGAMIWGKAREMFTLQKVLEAMPDVTFYWVGDGPYREKILPSLSKYKNFKWLGHMQYPDRVREYLSEIDVYALVSGIDMSPLTLQEAQLMGKPVVATKVGGIPELMKDEETGFLVESGDSQGWIEKLSILISDESKAKKMGKTGREFVEKTFSWDVIAKNFVDDSRQYIK